jgi:hypothetical protein
MKLKIIQHIHLSNITLFILGFFKSFNTIKDFLNIYILTLAHFSFGLEVYFSLIHEKFWFFSSLFAFANLRLGSSHTYFKLDFTL